MTKKKRHHYIPRFYLDGFVDPHNKPYIWVYEKGNPKIVKATTKNIAVQKDYYSFTTPEGNRDSETFENLLAEIEGRVSRIFRKIRNQENLNHEERWFFSLFLAFSMARVPNFRENLEEMLGETMKKINMILASDPRNFEAMIESFQRKTGKEIGMPVEELRKFMLEGEYNFRATPQFSLGMAAIMARNSTPIFFEMKWTFLEATGDYKFVTSDNPLSYFDPMHDPKSFFGVGLLNENVEVTFPISKDLMFLGMRKNFEGDKRLSNKSVKEMNRRTVISALRFVFASQYSDGLNRLVQKYRDSAPRKRVDSVGPYIVAH